MNTTFQEQQAAKILSIYSNFSIEKSEENDIEKGRKAAPDGTKSKDGKWVKQAGKWVPFKGEINDKKKIKVNSPSLMSHSELHGKTFDVEKVREVYMASGPMKVYHVKDENGKEHEINEQFVEHLDDKNQPNIKNSIDSEKKKLESEKNHLQDRAQALMKIYHESIRPGKSRADYAKVESNRLWKKAETIDKKIGALDYNHKDVRKILKQNEIGASKASSTAIRGYNTFSSGFEINNSGVQPELIGFNHISAGKLNKVVNDLKNAGFSIKEVKEPSKTIGGGNRSFIILNKFDYK